MENGKWKMENGKWKMENQHINQNELIAKSDNLIIYPEPTDLLFNSNLAGRRGQGEKPMTLALL